ncbi:peptidase S24 [candidate division WOR-3 bacterium JGI_Cruoil_03_44_89]|uniref:Peptidase S24 n=1 Tax=candidate division WOR-3 bacterium JGI_Cruoil_03_44_89 TaxID=1973748 RepID=A0A235BPK0_UNCW3|nr:MAG: peptidase S24 [candidate division WOR-3 bacterium JGI_Cruoil_03_44_89]
MDETDIKKDIYVTEIWGFKKRTKREFPLYLAKISAGFPSPADDYIDKKLDLNESLVKHPAATFFVKVYGSSMVNAGINSGDTLIVDRALEPADNKIVLAVLDGDFTVKRIRKLKDKLYLLPENPNCDPIEVTEEMDFEVWGVVTYVIHSV